MISNIIIFVAIKVKLCIVITMWRNYYLTKICLTIIHETKLFIY